MLPPTPTTERPTGAEEGFHVRNQNPKVFSVSIAPTAAAYYIDAAGPDLVPRADPAGLVAVRDLLAPLPG